MKCDEVEKIIVDYIDNNLDEILRLEVDRHLEGCERCTDILIESNEILQYISKEEMHLPDNSLRINFHNQLQNEISRNEAITGTPQSLGNNSGIRLNWVSFAAGIALLITGTFIGYTLHSPGVSSSELSQLKAEVYELKRSTLYAMLKESSSSERIQAVSYAGEFENPDQKTINALIFILNNDKNANVRIASAYALSKFAGIEAVSDSLVKSLILQNDPLVQITLISILAEKNERRALIPIQEIIANKNTLPDVRIVAKNSLRTLI